MHVVEVYPLYLRTMLNVHTQCRLAACTLCNLFPTETLYSFKAAVGSASSIFQSLYPLLPNGNRTVLILIELPHICFYNLAVYEQREGVGGDCVPQTHSPAGHTLGKCIFIDVQYCALMFLFFKHIRETTTPLLLSVLCRAVENRK